jgi:hypothetical protein
MKKINYMGLMFSSGNGERGAIIDFKQTPPSAFEWLPV